MQTKDIMKLTGLDRETLRFYEKKGIITIPNRTASGYRKYNDEYGCWSLAMPTGPLCA